MSRTITVTFGKFFLNLCSLRSHLLLFSRDKQPARLTRETRESRPEAGMLGEANHTFVIIYVISRHLILFNFVLRHSPFIQY